MEARRCVLERYLAKRLLRPSARRGVLSSVLASIIPFTRPLILWGWGVYGKLVFELLQAADKDVALIFDKSPCSERAVVSPIVVPDVSVVKNMWGFVLITTLDYEDEISRELEQAEMEEGNDYNRVSRLLHNLMMTYISSFLT